MRIDSGVVVAILAVLGFIFASAGAYGQWKISRNTTALTQYRDIAQAWEAKARVLEVELGDLKEERHRKDAQVAEDLSRKDAQVAELSGKVTVLQDALTGKAAWDVLDRKIAEVLAVTAENRAEIRQVHQLLEGAKP